MNILYINNKIVGNLGRSIDERSITIYKVAFVKDSFTRFTTMASKNTEAKNNKKSNSGVDAGTQELPPMLSLVQKAATLDSNPSMKQAAEITLKIFQKVQVCTPGSCDHPLTI